MNNTPTPRTDAEIEDWVLGLNHMADDHLCCRATVLDTIELIKELRSERDQLRKVCDELANTVRDYDDAFFTKSSVMRNYSQLPHVIERKTK